MKTFVTTMDSNNNILSQQVTELAPHSIELTRTTRGYTWAIKMYFGEDGQANVIGQLTQIDAMLREKFIANDPGVKQDVFLEEVTGQTKKK